MPYKSDPNFFVSQLAKKNRYESVVDFLVATAGTEEGHLWLSAATWFHYSQDDLALICDAYVKECTEDGEKPDMRYFVAVTLEQDWDYDLVYLRIDRFVREHPIS